MQVGIRAMKYINLVYYVTFRLLQFQLWLNEIFHELREELTSFSTSTQQMLQM